MEDRRRGLLPTSLLAATAVFEVVSVGLSWGLEPRTDTVLYAFSWVTTAVVGAAVAQRHPRNPIGWLFLAEALFAAVASDALQGYALRSVAASSPWPGTTAAELVTYSSWLPSGLVFLLVFLLFPDGHLPGPRWRAVPWIGVAGAVLAQTGWMLSPDRGREITTGTNPLAVTALPTGALLYTGMVLFTLAFVASALAVVFRFRGAQGILRQQLKGFAFAALFTTVALPASFVLWYVSPLGAVLAVTALTLLPVAACVAILRYRLYDIDAVLDATVVYGAVTLLLAAAYGAIAVLVGTSFGGGSGWGTAAATLVVAVAFRPLRDRVQDLVDRRFHRARYRAVRRMADFLEALRAGTADPGDLESVLRELSGDERLRLFLHLPESQVDVDVQGAPVTDPVGLTRLEVERGGRRLGTVWHQARAGEDLTLLRRVVGTGGLAVEIARLDVELRRQLDEVRASRERLVLAGTRERRRLERDLHDGAQQRLVSIGLALRHAQHQIRTATPAEASRTVDEAVAEVTVAIGELRELTRGLPPAQLDAGLAPAFRDLARRAGVPVQVSTGPERFAVGVEGAAWFIGCEGVTNAVKHARATRIGLTAGRREDRLVVVVTDDGVGGAAPAPGSGLAGLADRVAALGGELRIDSRPGAGTTLTAELPCGS